MPEDARVRFSTFYTPHDIVGGDYYAIRQLNADQYGFLLADVMGHGVAAALHTMHLSSLWDRNCHLLTDPADFAGTVNNELAKIVKDESFATAICGVIDAKQRTVRFAAAGGPSVLVVHPSGTVEELESSGMPFGMMEGSSYKEVTGQLAPTIASYFSATVLSKSTTPRMRCLESMGWSESSKVLAILRARST